MKKTVRKVLAISVAALIILSHLTIIKASTIFKVACSNDSVKSSEEVSIAEVKEETSNAKVAKTETVKNKTKVALEDNSKKVTVTEENETALDESEKEEIINAEEVVEPELEEEAEKEVVSEKVSKTSSKQKVYEEKSEEVESFETEVVDSEEVEGSEEVVVASNDEVSNENEQTVSEPEVYEEKSEEVESSETEVVNSEEVESSKEEIVVASNEEASNENEPVISESEVKAPEEESKEEVVADEVEVITDEVKEPAKEEEKEEPHVHSFSDWYVTVEPTCVAEGEKTRICTTCFEEEEMSIQALGHISSEEYVTEKEATCTENGLKFKYCTREECSEVLEEVTIEATGHDLVEIITDATCTENGTTAVKCLLCDYEEAPKISSLAFGHQYSEYVSDGNATCIADGTKTATCIACGHTNTVDDINSKVDHTFVTINEKVLPTCESEGKEADRQCSVCGKIEYGTSLAALGHNLVVTSLENGIKTEKCTRCSIEYNSETGEITFGNGHKWNEDYLDCECEEHDDDEGIWWDCWKDEETRYVAIWQVGFKCDMSRCEGFNDHGSRNKVGTVVEGRRGDIKTITQTAPSAKAGYRFEGWYDLSTGLKRTDSTTITVGWDDMDKGFEARYEAIK